MYDTLLLIIALIILAETSLLVVMRRPNARLADTFRAGSRSILIDTSVLIDGRILDIAAAGFMPGRLVIPRSVLGELQLLADGADHDKRARARNGLDAVTGLQEMPNVSVEIYHDDTQNREGVDNRLLALARRFGYELCTVDFNLQKVAQAEGIGILSINELSQKLRALYLPGEKVELVLKQKGQEKGQAIGYATDGTMVVVDGGDKQIGQTVTVEIIRSLQTNSGKMMFARMGGDHGQRQRGNNGANVPRTAAEPQAAHAEPAQRQTQQRGRGGRGRRTIVANDAVSVTGDVSTGVTISAKPAADAKRPAGRSRGRGRQTPEDELLNLVNNQ